MPLSLGLQCWVPSAGALEASGLALKEVLGYAVQVPGLGPGFPVGTMADLRCFRLDRKPGFCSVFSFLN